MLPNTFPFYIFLGIAVVIYYSLPHGWRNPFLLLASLFFYGTWDWRFLAILLWQIFLCYTLGLTIGKTTSIQSRKRLLCIGVILAFCSLCFFKYFNFLNDSVRHLCQSLGLTYIIPHLNILLPLGISFFTFQSFGYVLDVYWNKIQPEKDFLRFSLFIAFFPQIAAGPIGRASELLPQFHSKRIFSPDAFEEGLGQLLWGIFKKCVIADRLAEYVDAVYANPSFFGSSTLLLAAVFFSIQIYSDFSGYSDIALGTARLFGIDLRKNFDYPYFATGVREFWKRWHISLTSWFRDYLYIPLGGNRCSALRQRFNVMTVFLASGLWHGANWTFVVWGGMHGVLQLLETRLIGKRSLSNASFTAKVLAATITFFLVTLAWVFFRAPDFKTAFFFLRRLFVWQGSFSAGVSMNTFIINLALLMLFLAWEIWDVFHKHIKSSSIWQRSVRYAFLLSLISMFGKISAGFIYQQF